MSNENTTTTTTTHTSMKDALAAATQEVIEYPEHADKRAQLTRDAGNLIDLRRASGLTQARFAYAIGVSRGALANWENARHPVPARLAAFAAKLMRRFDWGASIVCGTYAALVPTSGLTADHVAGLRAFVTAGFDATGFEDEVLDFPEMTRFGSTKGSRYR